MLMLMLLPFEGQQLTQGLPRTITLPTAGIMFPGQKNTGCHRREFMREKRVIIRPPERKFSKQMEISKGREESQREEGSFQGHEREGHTFLSILLWFPNALHKITLPASPELHSHGCHTLETCQRLNLTEGMPLALPLQNALVFFQVMSVNLDICSDKNICQVYIRLTKHHVDLLFFFTS